MYLVNGAVRERDDEQVAVRPGLNIGDHPEIRAEQQRFALDDVELARVVGDPVLEIRILDAGLHPVSRQVEMEQVPAREKRSRDAHEKLVLVLRAQRPNTQKSDPCRRDLEFQLNSGSEDNGDRGSLFLVQTGSDPKPKG